MTQEKNDAARVDSGDGGALLEGGSSGEGSSSGDSLAGGEPAGRKHDPNDGPTLDSLKAGQCAIIKAVRGHGELRRHLLDMGLTPGIGVRVRKVAPMGDPIQIELRGYELTLRLSEADNVHVRALDPQDRSDAPTGADAARSQADFLKRHLASSIVRDFEYLRLVGFGGKPWVTLGQSYGGFLTLSYLSLFPEGVVASFTCGGIPHAPASASEVYAHTFPRMAAKTQQYYDRYPADVERVAALADALEAQKPVLPDGSPMTVERLQLMGSDFGMKPSFERMHWIIDHAFVDGDGTLTCDASVSDSFLMRAFERTNTRTNPLYWTLQEFIYADGDTMPIGWAAAEEKAHRAEFDTLARPLMFTGEAMFPWMFEQMPELKPFKPAMDLLMEDTSWDKIYDPQRLACNEVPLQAAVYFDDMYVDSGLQLDTLSRVGNSHAWVTNEFEHDGLHGSVVFKHLFDEALNRGDLRRIF